VPGAIVTVGAMSRVSRLVSRVRGRPSEPSAPDPTGFYRAAPAGDGRRGELLAVEQMPTSLHAAQAWRVRYRTLDAAERPVPASLAMAAPLEHGSERPVVVWVHGAVGVAPGCGPSRTRLDMPYAAELLAAGSVVVAPDLTGLGIEGVEHPYLHGTTAGRAVLDALRAAADLPEAGAGRVAALCGHSAGGHAVLWANQLAVDEGDDIDVRRAVAISPIADLAVAIGHYATTAGNAAYPVQVAATWPGVEPVDERDVLTPAALERLAVLHTGCLADVLQTFRGDASRWVRADGFRRGAWATALAEQAAGRMPGRAEVAVIHGAEDRTARPAWSTQLVAEIVGAGGDAAVHVIDGADHVGVIDAARRDIVTLLDQ
jgi:acetyl esterase/lipase